MATNETKTPKKVKVILPLTRNEKEDVYACVNGKAILIKRGEEVEIDPCYVEVLRNKETLLAKSIAFEDQAKSNDLGAKK